jgi:calpain-15
MSQAEQDRIGLISGHAYSFLKFLKIEGETVVKMRNPWGRKIWQGEWSYESKKWTK